MKARVLLVDDDPAVLSGLRRALALEDYEVITAPDGESALQLARDRTPDVVVLDVMLPGLDGFTVCQRLQAISFIPVLMLTARDTGPDRVAGLDSGADDYLVKPFAIDELLARVRALIRRTRPTDHRELSYADVRLDLLTREAYRAGNPLPLSSREFDLLEVFMRHPRQVLTRDQLSQSVWGYAFEGESNFIDVAVKELRRKLEADNGPRIVQTVRGYGYALRQE
jgi:two-component system response regulator MprA